MMRSPAVGSRSLRSITLGVGAALVLPIGALNAQTPDNPAGTSAPQPAQVKTLSGSPVEDVSDTAGSTKTRQQDDESKKRA